MTVGQRIVMCEACQGEGRLMTGNGNDPYPTDHGSCPWCDGTGGEIIKTRGRGEG